MQALRGDISGYKIEYKLNVREAELKEVLIRNAQTTEYVLDGLEPYKTYAIIIKATNCGGDGPSSFVREKTLEGGT